MTKKILSLLLCLATIFSLFSVSVAAEPSVAEDDYSASEMPPVEDDDYAASSRDVVPATGVAPQVDPIGDLPPANVSGVQNTPTENSVSALQAGDSIVYPDGVTFHEVGSPVLRSAYANYNGAAAASYAVTYALNPNSQYKVMDADKDCTNFVSQAIAVGGVVSYISNFNTAPSVLKDWIMEDNANAWYMVKKTRLIGFNYWVYSRTWSFVDDFRAFHVARSAGGGNTFSGTLSGNTPNTTPNENTNFEYKLRKYAEVGQVWQLSGHHSIIITAVQTNPDGYNYVWYSAHSGAKQNADIQIFLNFCKLYPSTPIYRLRFS